MITGSKHIAVVGKNGKIEICDSQLPEGAEVEVIVLLEAADHVRPNYRPELIAARDRVERGEGLVSFTAEEWDAKYSNA
jgi:hypothetical protein